MTSEASDLYRVLGVTPGATQAEVRRAYLSLMRQNHPDTRPSSDPSGPGVSDAALQEALAAYTILGDPERRAGYDERVARQHTPSASPAAPRPVPRSFRTDPRQPPITVGPVRWHRSR
ncbi:J domain-containing protein [Knoellia sp. CPCC 206435]|uniref:J domain-containing protein n=1 Tax=Knoellia terrae TaxID=3404797 RepID=UPI003B4305DC